MNRIGLLRISTGDLRAALESYERAGELFRAAGDRHGEASASNNAGEFQKAMECYQRALAQHQAGGERPAQATVLNNKGKLYAEMGEWPQPRNSIGEPLPCSRNSAIAATKELLYTISEWRTNSPIPEEQPITLKIRRETGDRLGEAETLYGLGAVSNRLGERKEALGLHGPGLDTLPDGGQPQGASPVEPHNRQDPRRTG